MPGTPASYLYVYNAREGLIMTAFAFTDSTSYVPIIYPHS